MINKRSLILYISLLGILALAIAYFVMQQYLGLEPCPLCIIDRYAIGIMSIAGFVYWYIYPRAGGILTVVMFLAIVVGMVSGGRHVYVEWFPFQVDSCFFPSAKNTVTDFFINAFVERSDCALVDWRLFGISLAEMTFGLFVFLFILMIYISFFKKNHE